MSKPIFLVGAPRSGTTLLAEMLSQCANIFIFNETVFYDAVVRIDGATVPDDVDRLRQLSVHLLGRIDARLSRNEGNDEEFGGRFSREEAVDIKSYFMQKSEDVIAKGGGSGDLLREFMQIVSEVKGKRVWGEKTPNHAFHIKRILLDFPDAIIVNVVRDPYSFLLSYKFSWRQLGGNKENKKLYHPVVTSLLWNKYINELAWLPSSDYSEQVVEVRYEELVASPEDGMKKLCGFLDLEMVSTVQMIGGSNSSFSKKKESLSVFEKGACALICRQGAKRYGYKVEPVLYALPGFFVSLVSLPWFIAEVLPIIRRRFGGSLFNYFKARNVFRKKD